MTRPASVQIGRAAMPKRRGFTLLELLLATVLTSVLMIGVLSVIVRVSAPLRANDPDQQASIASDASGWFALIREDLGRATDIESIDEGELVFLGYAGTDVQDCSWTQRPVRVRYAVRSVEGESWLLRYEQPFDVDGKPSIRPELIASGVTRIELVEDEAGTNSKRSRRTAKEDETAAERDGTALPGETLWRLRIWAGHSGSPAIERSLVLKRGLSI